MMGQLLQVPALPPRHPTVAKTGVRHPPRPRRRAASVAARAAGGGWEPSGDRPGCALASHWAGSTLPGGTTAQRARGANLDSVTAGLVRTAPRGKLEWAKFAGLARW
jgi:hypothetical protein